MLLNPPERAGLRRFAGELVSPKIVRGVSFSRALSLERLLLLAALSEGAALGWLAWRPDGALALIVLLPLLGALQPTRAAAGLLWFGYFLASSHDLVPVVARFFPGEPWTFGIALWTLDAAVLALPWMLLWPKGEDSQGIVAVRTVIALVLFTVPPIGCLAWLSPLLAAGVLFPGWGWIGIACAVALFGVFATVGHAIRAGNVAGIRYLMGPATGLLIASAGANLAFRPPTAPEGWVALDTQLGRFPTEHYAGFQRQQELMRIAEKAIRAGAKVIVVPEEVAGTWRTAVAYWWRPLGELAARHGATVLVGADVPDSPGLIEAAAPRFNDSLVMLGAMPGLVSARVPIPVASWRPGSNTGAIAHLTGSGIVELHGMRVAASICYEDFLAWPVLLSFAQAPRPQILLSAANNWFSDGLDSPEIQRRSIELWARLFGVPLLRAVNLHA